MKQLSILFIFVAAIFIGCGERNNCYRNHYQSLTNYEVKPTAVTPKGIGVDPGGQVVDLQKIDRLTDELEACLNQTFGENPTITADLAMQADCRPDGWWPKTHINLPISIKRGCVTIKIPDDWTISSCSGEEVLNLMAPEELCRAKGVIPTPECPCRWRVATQDDNVIVTPPGLKLYKAELARIATGCNNVWLLPQIATCL
jgi:hypothetical protein